VTTILLIFLRINEYTDQFKSRFI